jgi:hypothetical protein
MATELWLNIGHEWTLVQSTPTNDFDCYSLFPLEWLRFLGFIGRQGKLLSHPDGEEGPNYTDDVGDLRDHHYYAS